VNKLQKTIKALRIIHRNKITVHCLDHNFTDFFNIRLVSDQSVYEYLLKKDSSNLIGLIYYFKMILTNLKY